MSGRNRRLVNILAIIPQYKVITGQVISKYTAIEEAALGLRAIGNVHVGNYVYRAEVEDYRVQLPCNVLNISAITLARDYQIVSFFDTYYGMPSIYIGEGFSNLSEVEGVTRGTFETVNQTDEPLLFTSQLKFQKPAGPYIEYKFIDEETLEFPSTGHPVDIFYTTVIRDCDGYPMITEEAATACAYYSAFLEVQRQAFQGIKGAAEKVKFFEDQKDRYVSQANIGSGLSVNDMDAVLNVFTSHNRKFFNKPWHSEYPL